MAGSSRAPSFLRYRALLTGIVPVQPAVRSHPPDYLRYLCLPCMNCVLAMRDYVVIVASTTVLDGALIGTVEQSPLSSSGVEAQVVSNDPWRTYCCRFGDAAVASHRPGRPLPTTPSAPGVPPRLLKFAGLGACSRPGGIWVTRPQLPVVLATSVTVLVKRSSHFRLL